MAKNGSVTIEKVYELVDRKINEVNASIKSLDDKFGALEAGRLSHLETTVANLQGRIIATTGLIAFVISIAITIVGLILRK